MVFKRVECIPGGMSYKRTKLKELYGEFLQTGYKYAEVDVSEYKTPKVAYGVLKHGLVVHAMTKSVRVHLREDKVYFENLQMEE